MYGLIARILHIVGLALFAGIIHADDQTRLDYCTNAENEPSHFFIYDLILRCRARASAKNSLYATQ